MITILISIIVCALVGLFCAYINRNNYWHDSGNYLFNSFIGAFVGLILGFIVAMIIPPDRITDKFDNEIVCLQDNNSISGSFMLGCGSINGSMKYVFYVSCDGGFKMNQLNYNEAIIKYTDGTPHISTIVISPDPKSTKNLFTLRLAPDFRYEIYVPAGTVKMNYSLDTK